MAERVLYSDRSFTILQTKRDVVLIRNGTKYEQHAHFRNPNGAKKLINLFNRNLMPTKQYFKTAMRRICNEEEFNSLIIKSKLKYINRS